MQPKSRHGMDRKDNENSMKMTMQNPKKAEIEEKSNCTSKVDPEKSNGND